MKKSVRICYVVKKVFLDWTRCAITLRARQCMQMHGIFQKDRKELVWLDNMISSFCAQHIWSNLRYFFIEACIFFLLCSAYLVQSMILLRAFRFLPWFPMETLLCCFGNYFAFRGNYPICAIIVAVSCNFFARIWKTMHKTTSLPKKF